MWGPGIDEELEWVRKRLFSPTYRKRTWLVTILPAALGAAPVFAVAALLTWSICR